MTFHYTIEQAGCRLELVKTYAAGHREVILSTEDRAAVCERLKWERERDKEDRERAGKR